VLIFSEETKNERYIRQTEQPVLFFRMREGYLDGDENKTMLCYEQNVHRRHQTTPWTQNQIPDQNYAVSSQTWLGHIGSLAARFRT
jgi:hypothetical protein